MPRIAGVNIPENKRIEISLTYIYGVGRSLSRKILDDLKIDINKKASDLSPKEVNDLKDLIEKTYKIEGDLRRQIMINVKRLKDVGAWRGLRHMKGLPVRGQRTKSHFRTRGKKKAVGVQKKKPEPAKKSPAKAAGKK